MQAPRLKYLKRNQLLRIRRYRPFSHGILPPVNSMATVPSREMLPFFVCCVYVEEIQIKDEWKAVALPLRPISHKKKLRF